MSNRFQSKTAHCTFYKWWNIVLQKKLEQLENVEKLNSENVAKIQHLQKELKHVRPKISTPRITEDGDRKSNNTSLALEYIDDSYGAMEGIDDSFLGDLSDLSKGMEIMLQS